MRSTVFYGMLLRSTLFGRTELNMAYAQLQINLDKVRQLRLRLRGETWTVFWDNFSPSTRLKGCLVGNDAIH